MKKCYKCKVEKNLEDFHLDKKNRLGRASYCKDCAKEHSRGWYVKSEKYRQSIRDGGLKARFGIDSDFYYLMLEDQNGVCAICKEKSDKNLHVDHVTGSVRGLLCKNCNHGLGNFRNNKEFLQNAIEYL